MEEENEILGPDQPWSPDMLFTPSVEEEEEVEELYTDSSEVDPSSALIILAEI